MELCFECIKERQKIHRYHLFITLVYFSIVTGLYNKVAINTEHVITKKKAQLMELDRCSLCCSDVARNHHLSRSFTDLSSTCLLQITRFLLEFLTKNDMIIYCFLPETAPLVAVCGIAV